MSTKRNNANTKSKGNRHRTIQEIEDALTKARGLISVAARAMKYDRSSMYRRIQRSKRLQQHLENLRETNLDVAEAKLMQQVDAGNFKAVRFYLTTIGKHRGYGKEVKQQVNITVEDIKTMTDEELEAVADKLGL